MEYDKCLVELDEILNYLADEDLRKIPFEIRKAITEKKSKHYSWHYDESKELREQNINRQTIVMLSYLNMEYLLNKEQKLRMEEFHKLNEEKKEEEKRKYNQTILFKENKQNLEKEIKKDSCEDRKNNNNKQMIVKREEKWYQKLIQRIISIFHKSKKK